MSYMKINQIFTWTGILTVKHESKLASSRFSANYSRFNEQRQFSSYVHELLHDSSRHKGASES